MPVLWAPTDTEESPLMSTHEQFEALVKECEAEVRFAGKVVVEAFAMKAKKIVYKDRLVLERI